MALSLILLVLPMPYRDAIARGVRWVMTPVLALQRGASDRQGRFDDVARLRAERDSLASFLVGQSTLAAENRELRALLGFRGRLGYSYIPAEAVRMGGPLDGGTLQLNVGRAEGARPGMPIVTAEGLVGIVTEVEGHAAVGIDWTHPEFRVAAMSLDGETAGLAEPMTRRGRARLALSPIAMHARPRPGSMFVTSGDGLTYPRGIPIGTLDREEQETASWQRTYTLVPLVSPTEIAHVLLLGDTVRAGAANDLAAAWGVRLSGAPPPDSAGRLAPYAATPAAPPRPAATAPAPARRPARRGPPGTNLLGRPVDPTTERVPPGMPQPRDTSRIRREW